MSVRVQVSPGCTGMGACVRHAPQVFCLDPETGKAEVLLEDASAYRAGVLLARDSCSFVTVEIDGIGDPEPDAEATITAINALTADVIELRIRKPAYSYQPGQYAFIRLQDAHGEFHRPYSVVDNHQGEVAFCIKLLAHGRSGNALRRMKTGDAIGLGRPVGLFSLASIDEPKLFITGGTGVAPVLPLCRSAHSAAKTIILGFRTQADLFWLAELRAIPNTTVIPVVQESDPGWTGEVGLVTEVLERLELHRFIEFYTCGSPKMVSAVAAQLRERGISNDQIFCDAFTPAPEATRNEPVLLPKREVRAQGRDWHGVIRRLHFFASLTMAALILFYATTGFIANRVDFFNSEGMTKTPASAEFVPTNVTLNSESLTAYLLGVLPPGSRPIARTGNVPGTEFQLSFTAPDDQGQIVATVQRSTRKLTLMAWRKLPDAVGNDTRSLTTFITSRVSGDPDLKNCEDEEQSFRLDCESVWGVQSVAVDRSARLWRVTTSHQTPVVALIDLHRGKHTGVLQKLLVDVTAIVLIAVTLTGIAMGLAAAGRRRRLIVISLLAASSILLLLLLVAR